MRARKANDVQRSAVSELAAAIFAEIESCRLQGVLDGGLVSIGSEGLRVRIGEQGQGLLFNTSTILTEDRIGEIKPEHCERFASALLANMLISLAAQKDDDLSQGNREKGR